MLRSAGACQDGMSQRRIVRVADLHELGHHRSGDRVVHLGDCRFETALIETCESLAVGQRLRNAVLRRPPEHAVEQSGLLCAGHAAGRAAGERKVGFDEGVATVHIGRDFHDDGVDHGVA